MRRDYSSTAQSVMSVWGMVGWAVDSQDYKQIADIFCLALDEIIEFTYASDRTIYDELYVNEERSIVDGLEHLEKSKRETSNNFYSKLQINLRAIDWDSVLMHIQSSMDEYASILPARIYDVLKSKKRFNDARSLYGGEYNSDAVDVAFEKMSVLIPKTHWIYRVFKNHWRGCVYDVLSSPLLSLVSIDASVTNNIKDISDILADMSSVKTNNTSKSAIVEVKTIDRIFMKHIASVCDAIQNKTDLFDPLSVIRKKMIEEGAKREDIYLMVTALYWMGATGSLRGFRIDTEKQTMDTLAKIFNRIRISGYSSLLEYPIKEFE